MRLGASAAAAIAASVVLGACGSSHERSATSVPGGADPAATKVVRAWADALRRGNVEAAADLFALPSRVQVVPGTPFQLVVERADALAFNLTLPCGGRLVKATRRGDYVNALFLLSDRPGSKCDAPGATARAALLVRDGKIAVWRRLGAEPGDERYEKRKSPRVGPVV
jgi:hypothetical protein